MALVPMMVLRNPVRSQGYEWVYPLQTMDDEASAAYFFRWDFDQCPFTETLQLVRAIDTAIKQFPNVETLTIVGHDKGGILVSALVDKLSARQSVEMHTVVGRYPVSPATVWDRLLPVSCTQEDPCQRPVLSMACATQIR